MDYKTAYSQSVSAAKQVSEAEEKLSRAISAGEYRKDVYGSNWASVDINEVVDRLAPGAEPVQIGGKIVFNSNDGEISIVADIGGGYLRVLNPNSGEYLDEYGNSVHNYTDENGKQHGRSHSDYLAHTHFRIKKKGEQ